VRQLREAEPPQLVVFVGRSVDDFACPTANEPDRALDGADHRHGDRVGTEHFGTYPEFLVKFSNHCVANAFFRRNVAAGKSLSPCVAPCSSKPK
jgi:hypothetical protein